MAVKAVALIEQINNVGTSDPTFNCDIRYVHVTNPTAEGSIHLTGISAGILGVLFEQMIKDEVKAALGLGALDTVRLIGATLV